MEYDLKNIKHHPLRYDISIGGRYGSMPNEMLIAKYEETDMGPEENVYNDYARSTLSDFRPDTAAIESDAPRGRTNAQSATLQLRYNGHRGDTEDAQHPEIFTGFIGADNVDPRGHADEPDMKQFTSQQNSRMRFVNLDPDMMDDITGGGRGEQQLEKDKSTMRSWTRSRLKVFSRQIDGRVEGVRKVWRYCSAKSNQEIQQPYRYQNNDYYELASNNAKAAKLVKTLVRNRDYYRDETLDGDLQVQRYTQNGRKGAKKNNQQRIHVMTLGGNLADADQSQTYKNIGILLNKIVNQRGNMQKTVKHDQEYGEQTDAQARKLADMTDDLTLVLRAISHHDVFGNSDTTLLTKTGKPQNINPLMNVVVYNHVMPAHTYHIAEKMYKSVQEGSDMDLIRRQIADDRPDVTLADIKSQLSKNAKLVRVNDRKKSEIFVIDETKQTYNYKLARPQDDRRTSKFNGEDFKKESDLTYGYKNKQNNHKGKSINDTEEMQTFSDNYKMERLTGRMGDKNKVKKQMVSDENKSAFADNY